MMGTGLTKKPLASGSLPGENRVPRARCVLCCFRFLVGVVLLWDFVKNTLKFSEYSITKLSEFEILGFFIKGILSS